MKKTLIRNYGFLMGALLGFGVLFGCSTTNEEIKPENKITIEDSTGNIIEFSQTPKRVVSLSPNLTEIIEKLDGSDKLVGKTDYCNFPESVQNITTVGDIMEPSIEKIIELQPDVVFSTFLTNKDINTKIADMKIPVVIVNELESFEGTFETIKIVGDTLGVSNEAEKLINDMQEDINEIVKKIGENSASKPTVYYMVGYGEGGDFTAGGDTFIGQLINMSKGINIADDVQGWNYSLEKLIENDPDIIITSQSMNAKDNLSTLPGYKDLKAVKNGKVYEINEDLVSRQGPRIVLGFEEIAKIINPLIKFD